MSGRRRNLAPLQKFNLPLGRQLPEIINEYDKESIESSFSKQVDISYSDRLLNPTIYNGKQRHHSTVSSAASHKFIDLYNKVDWPSLSDTGTDSPEYLDSGSSGSSASSVFSWADPNGTMTVAEEWEKIQRTIYDEDGPKVTQKHLIDECMQWKNTFPHLRIVGKKCLPTVVTTEPSMIEDDNVLFQIENSFDKEDMSFDSKELDDYPDLNNLKFNITKEKFSGFKSNIKTKSKKNKSNTKKIEEHMESNFHISPISSAIQLNSLTASRVGTCSSLIRSEISSSRWRHKNNASPEFTSLPPQNSNYVSFNENTQTRKSSAASVYSLNSNMHNGNETFSSHIRTNIRRREKSILLKPFEPVIFSKMLPIRSISISHALDIPKSSNLKNRLPPLSSNENKNMNLSNNFTPAVKNNRRNKTLAPINLVDVKIYTNGEIAQDFNRNSSHLGTKLRKKKF